MRLTLAASALSLIMNVVGYFRLGEPPLPPPSPTFGAGMTSDEKIADSIEFVQRTALASIQLVVHSSLKGRAFQGACWSACLLGVFGHLEWRIRRSGRP